MKNISEQITNLTSINEFNKLKNFIEKNIIDYGNKIFKISVWNNDNTSIFKYDTITNNYQYKPISNLII